jgi:hypothetical protein
VRYDPHMAAQGLGEYGGLASRGAENVSTGLSDLASTVEEALRNPTPRTWIAIALFFFALWFLFIRRR